jgi:hypothetical protein
MDRRSFLLHGAGAGLALAGSAAGYARWQEIAPTVQYPGRAEGHWLRDRRPLPAPERVLETDVAILGSGIAGLSAAWQLRRAGHERFLMVDGPQPDGNAAGGRFGEYAYPTGAHYLPLPSPESTHVREILLDLGIIERDAFLDQPRYDEAAILHAPEERLLYQGAWQDGFLPVEGVAGWELAEHKRFFATVEALRAARGSDGRRAFVFPTVMSSTDPQWQQLDRITLKDWLEREGYRAPTLHWYLNYCCRDDYGSRYDKVSAWAGLHYYCSRWGQAANAGNGAWLTWPGGLARSYLVRARKAIVAMPVYVAARVVEGIRDLGFDPKRHTPSYAPWLVASFLMKAFPRELPHAPLSWDNVVYGEPGLGYVVSTHQDIRVTPPEKTVFTAYVALSDRSPDTARKWMMEASPDELVELAARDLKAAYGWAFAPCVEKVDITLRGHAMAAPLPGFRSNAGMAALRAADGPILFAHADLSGFSVFEEAAWWGIQAARKALS